MKSEQVTPVKDVKKAVCEQPVDPRVSQVKTLVVGQPVTDE